MAILSMFSTLGACALGVCARRTTLKSEPLHLADGCLIINRDVTGRVAFCAPAGLVRRTAPALSRLTFHNGIPCGQSVREGRV